MPNSGRTLWRALLVQGVDGAGACPNGHARVAQKPGHAQHNRIVKLVISHCGDIAAQRPTMDGRAEAPKILWRQAEIVLVAFKCNTAPAPTRGALDCGSRKPLRKETIRTQQATT